MSLSPAELGRRLREARQRALLSQDDVGGRLGVARGTVARWERGSRDISFASLQALAAALGTTVAGLIGAEAAAPAPAACQPGWAGPAWERLPPLERQSIERIAVALAAHPERLPAALTLLSDGPHADDNSPPEASDVLRRIVETDVDQLTPMGALALLDEFKRQLRHAAAPPPLAGS